MTSSGTYAFGDTRASELAIEIFERCGIRAAEITVDHLMSVRRSMNLVLARWSNLGVNLWTVTQEVTPLAQGVGTYAVPPSTIQMLTDSVVIRLYQMGSPTSFTPGFATTASSATITVTQANHGYGAGSWINVIVPISVGGLILYGFYQVVSVPDANTYTFAAASAATATDSPGVVPQFTTGAGSATVTVALPDNGYLPGESFVVDLSTAVGGITLLGSYTIDTVVDPDTFTITATVQAGAAESVYENDGEAQVAGQSVQPNSGSSVPGYTDRLIYPISRGEWEAQPNKLSQGVPSSYWFDRLINPTVTLWQVPDGNGPYELRYFRSRQIEDVNPQGSETVNIPYRFMEAFCSACAAHLAIKWKPDAATALATDAALKWQEAADEDRERVSVYMVPNTGAYWGFG